MVAWHSPVFGFGLSYVIITFKAQLKYVHGAKLSGGHRAKTTCTAHASVIEALSVFFVRNITHFLKTLQRHSAAMTRAVDYLN